MVQPISSPLGISRVFAICLDLSIVMQVGPLNGWKRGVRPLCPLLSLSKCFSPSSRPSSSASKDGPEL